MIQPTYTDLLIAARHYRRHDLPVGAKAVMRGKLNDSPTVQRVVRERIAREMEF